MGLIDEYVNIRIVPFTKIHYENLGYEIPTHIYGANKNSIIACCKHTRNYTYSGKLPNGTRLEWMYYNDYLKHKAS